MYEKNFGSYVILKNFGITLNRDWFTPPKPYKTSINKLVEKDITIENFLRNDFLNVLKNEGKIFSSSEQDLARF